LYVLQFLAIVKGKPVRILYIILSHLRIFVYCFEIDSVIFQIGTQSLRIAERTMHFDVQTRYGKCRSRVQFILFLKWSKVFAGFHSEPFIALALSSGFQGALSLPEKKRYAEDRTLVDGFATRVPGTVTAKPPWPLKLLEDRARTRSLKYEYKMILSRFVIKISMQPSHSINISQIDDGVFRARYCLFQVPACTSFRQCCGLPKYKAWRLLRGIAMKWNVMTTSPYGQRSHSETPRTINLGLSAGFLNDLISHWLSIPLGY